MKKYLFVFDHQGELYSTSVTYDNDEIAIKQANLNPITHEVSNVRTGEVIWQRNKVDKR